LNKVNAARMIICYRTNIQAGLYCCGKGVSGLCGWQACWADQSSVWDTGWHDIVPGLSKVPSFGMYERVPVTKYTCAQVC